METEATEKREVGAAQPARSGVPPPPPLFLAAVATLLLGRLYYNVASAVARIIVS